MWVVLLCLRAFRVSTVLSISSHVASGAVGNRVALACLQRDGHKVIAVNTISLSWHPGQIPLFGRPSRAVPPLEAFSEKLTAISMSVLAREIDAVLTGYLGEAAQAEPIAAAIDRIRAVRPDCLVVCDPVMGDAGGLYVPSETATAIRDRLVPLADWITPNRHELGWLVGRTDLATNAALAMAARRLPVANTIVTSAFAPGADIANLMVDGPDRLAIHESVAAPPSGTGDMFAASFLSGLLSGHSTETALVDASARVATAVHHAVEHGLRDLDLSFPASDTVTVRLADAS